MKILKWFFFCEMLLCAYLLSPWSPWGWKEYNLSAGHCRVGVCDGENDFGLAIMRKELDIEERNQARYYNGNLTKFIIERR